MIEPAEGVHLKIGFRTTALLLLSATMCAIAGAQAFPTATQPLQLSAFGAGTGTWTGLSGGRNLGITAGVDLGWKPFYGFYPAAEVRGTYPVAVGQVDSQKNILVGFRASRYYGRFHPYADFLIGRDKVIYENGGYPNPTGALLYIDSVSNVLSYGGGLDLTLSHSLSLKVDAQLQHYGVPVNTSGHIYSVPVSVGVVYHFDFNHHIHYNKDGQMKGYRPPPPPPSTRTMPASDTSAPPAKPSPDTPPAQSQQP